MTDELLPQGSFVEERLMEILRSDPTALAALRRIYAHGIAEGMERAAKIAESGAAEPATAADKWTLGVYRGHQWAARDIRRASGWSEFLDKHA